MAIYNCKHKDWNDKIILNFENNTYNRLGNKDTGIFYFIENVQ